MEFKLLIIGGKDMDKLQDQWNTLINNIRNKPEYINEDYKEAFSEIASITKTTINNMSRCNNINDSYSQIEKVKNMEKIKALNVLESTVLLNIVSIDEENESELILVDVADVCIFIKNIMEYTIKFTKVYMYKDSILENCNKLLSENYNEICKSLREKLTRAMIDILSQDIGSIEVSNRTKDEGKNKYSKKYMEQILSLAKEGSVDTYIIIADYYYFKGNIYKYNYLKAIKWYTIAKEYENTEAEVSISRCYLWGNGVDKNIKIAFELCEIAAKTGNVYAENDLGTYYFYGLGTKCDCEKAVYWYTKSASAGNKSAALNLGLLYTGTVNEDCEKALYWYEVAATL